mgnify:FL=1
MLNLNSTRISLVKLIDDWKKAWRLWSVQLNIITIIILTILNDLPSHIIASWSLLPEELKSQIDKEVIAYVTMGLVVINILSRLVSQTNATIDKEIHDLKEKEDAEHKQEELKDKKKSK